MAEENPSAIEPLDLRGIQDILSSPGPCITIALPPHRPGEGAASTPDLLRASIRDAAERLKSEQIPESECADLLAPCEQLANAPAFLAGSRWSRVIFRSRGVFKHGQVRHPLKPALTVAGSFSIRQCLEELWAPRLFYILALSKESVSLFRCTSFRVQAVELPGGTPAPLEEALALEPPDRDLANRASAGAATSPMQPVRFGTGLGRETRQAHLADFYKLIDRGIRSLLREFPLILTGVDEDISLYRRVSACPRLAREAIRGSADVLSHEAEVLRQAHALFRAEETERESNALERARERLAPRRFSTDTDAIVHAAFDGRVSDLYISESSCQRGLCERPNYRSCGEEDLLNLAAVQTFLHGGKAFLLPAGAMRHAPSAAAVMRF